MESKTALKKIDEEIKILKQKKQHIKWINRIYKQHHKLVKRNINLIFYDNDEYCQDIFDNLPYYTKTLCFLNYNSYNKLKLDNLPISLEKIIILETNMETDDIENKIKLPFGCQILYLKNYNNNLYHNEKNDEDKKLYNYYTDILNIQPETNLYTIKKVLGKQTIINIDVDKNKYGKKLLQTSSIDYCDYYKFYYNNKVEFDNIQF